jgi:hypothetical protein
MALAYRSTISPFSFSMVGGLFVAEMDLSNGFFSRSDTAGPKRRRGDFFVELGIGIAKGVSMSSTRVGKFRCEIHQTCGADVCQENCANVPKRPPHMEKCTVEF